MIYNPFTQPFRTRLEGHERRGPIRHGQLDVDEVIKHLLALLLPLPAVELPNNLTASSREAEQATIR